jgi:hypothetical protein
MPQFLTSWKEIGQYLDKGVRTVQRWERIGGLPVRRQPSALPHAVIAIPDELDSWARTRTRGPSGALAGAMQRQMVALRAKNDGLRARVDALEAAVLGLAAADTAQTPATFLRWEESVQVRFARTVVPADGDGRGERQKIHLAAQQGRAEAVRVRLSFASTLCSLIERRARDGDSVLLQRARHAVFEIRRSLERPGYVPRGELDDLRALLRKVALRLESITTAATLGPRGAFGLPRPATWP